MQEVVILVDDSRRAWLTAEDVADFSLYELEQALEYADEAAVLGEPGEYKFSIETIYERDERSGPKEQKLDRRRKGYVYFLAGPDGLVKIGRSRSPKERTGGLKLPFETEILAVIPTLDMKALERQYHEEYADKRVRGEWFEFTQREIEEIRGDIVSELYQDGDECQIT